LVVAAAALLEHYDAMGDGVISEGRGSDDAGPDPRADVPGKPLAPVWLAPALVGTAALREPGSAVAARQQARRDAGLEPDGLGYPRMQLWVLLVLPSAVIAALCLIALLVSGIVILGIAGAAAAAVAGASTGYLMSDRLRMATSERRELMADRSWHSEQPWIGALTQTPERRLVAQAQDAVARLVGAPAWSSPAFDGHRVRLDLKAELEEIDGQAYQLAASDPARDANGAPAPEPTPPAVIAHRSARDALGRRVGALSAYADAVSALSPEPPASESEADDAQVQRALTATVRDEFATDQWTALRRELPAQPLKRSI
jgi:hypothetical protein